MADGERTEAAKSDQTGRFVPTLVVAQWLPGLIMLGISRLVANRLPNEKVPLHWNAQNQVDRWGSPQELVWTPCIFLVFALIWTIIMLFLRANLIKRGDEAGHTLTVFLLGGLCMQIIFAVIDMFAIVAADPHWDWWPTNFGIDKVAMLLTGLTLVVIGNFAPKIRPNGVSGFRVPGAYASREAWRRCQQFGGALFMILGCGHDLGCSGLWRIQTLLDLWNSFGSRPCAHICLWFIRGQKVCRAGSVSRR